MEYRYLVDRFLSKEITEEELDQLKSWLSDNPENRKLFNEDNELWQLAGLQISESCFRTEKAWNEIYDKLGLGSASRSIIYLSQSNFRIYIAAASIVCLIAIGSILLWTTATGSLKQAREATTLVSTGEKEKSHIYFADSSSVFLNSGSTLSYTGSYNLKDRMVKLTGEGFFDVRTNPSKPFVVETDKLSVTATGTRFNVFSYPDADRVETTLEEGKANVNMKGKSPMEIKPGQQAVYFRGSKKIIVRNVETDTYTSWTENKLRFIDTPFQEVMRKIARAYKVKIEITNHELLNLKYTATFIDESIEQVMEMLKMVSPITYKIYYRTKAEDKKYTEPRIVIGMIKTRKAID